MNAELLQFANDHHPDLINKVAAGLVVLEKLYPEEAKEVKEDLAFIAGKTQEGVKTASGGSDLKRFGMAVGATAAAGLASAVASDLYDAVKRGLSKGGNFKRIMEANPDLAKSFDKSQLRSSFNVVHRYAPEFTADPIMGGAVLHALANNPHSEHAVVEKLINARRNLLDAKRNQFSPDSAKADFIFKREKKDEQG